MAGQVSMLYTPDLHKRLIRYVSDGHTMTAACALCGISPSTLRSWLTSGRGNIDSAYTHLAFEMEQAQGIGRAKIESTMLRLATEPQQTKRVITEKVTENRRDNQGEEYIYTRRTKKIEVVETPIDWRAPMEVLKRRAPEDWQMTPVNYQEEKPKIRVTNPSEALKAIAPRSIREQSAEDIVDAEVTDGN